MRPSFLVDVDHTLANFDSNSGNRAVKEELLRLFPEKQLAAEMFGEIYDSIFAFHTCLSTDSFYADKINSYDVEVPDDISKPDFKFSRELYIKYVSNEFGLNLSANEIERIVSTYWNAIVNSTRIYPDAIGFMQRHEKKFITAGSDNRLKFEAGKIFYDPDFSWKCRFDRTMKVFSGFFRKEQILIGDPYGKPSREFWELCLAKSKIQPEQGVVIDDSLKVVKSAMDFGFKGVLLDRSKAHDKNFVDADFYAVSFDDLDV